MNEYPWYKVVGEYDSLSQGDVLLDCPILRVAVGGSFSKVDENDVFVNLKASADRCDVITMTQACDIENSKVSDIILCPHYSVAEYKESWEQNQSAKKEKTNEETWKKHLKQIKQGHFWNYSLLNKHDTPEFDMDFRIVDFHEIFSLPRAYLDEFIRDKKRLRLLPPYREHLSQAFARFFMRVGLPIDLKLK